MHRGARGDLTALGILPFGREKAEAEPDEDEAPKKGAARKPRAKKEARPVKAAKK